MTERYSEDRRCPKCGRPARARYQEVSHYTKQDYIVRTCVNCGYEWSELPLDANAGTEP